MKPGLKVFKTTNVDILKLLQMEEYMFWKSDESFCVLNHGSLYPRIVMGSYNDPIKLLNINNVLNDDIKIIKRFTGGGTVFVDNNTYFMSIISNSHSISNNAVNKLGPREIMNWTNIYMNELFNGVTDKYTFNIMEYIDYCLINNDTNMYKKIGGNAQKISGNRFIHHTSFLWKYDVEMMNKYLLNPKSQPKYRENRDHNQFLMELSQLFNHDINLFENNIMNGLRNIFDINMGNESELNEYYTKYINDGSPNIKNVEYKTRIINDELSLNV